MVPGRQQAGAELHDTQIAPSERETITQTISHPPPVPYHVGLEGLAAATGEM